MQKSMDFKEAHELVNSSSKILVTSHIRPDGDAIGSIISITRSIRAQAKLDGREIICQPLLLSYAGESYKFLLNGDELIVGENTSEEQITNQWLDEFDLIIVVDTRAARQLTIIGDYLVNRTADSKPVLAIDHHISGDEIGTCQVIDTQASAAGEIVYKLCRAGDWPMDRKALEAVFTSICTDTGWFRFQNTTADSFAITSELLNGGVKVDSIYQRLFQQHDPAKVLLMSVALESLKLLCDGKLAVMTITNHDMEKCGADRSHIENIVNEPMQIGTVEVSVMCVEMEEPNKTRFSLRSKNNVDVNAIANTLGGGGHARAAGVTVLEPIEAARKTIIEAISKELI